jgi:hypothetical protein
MRFRTHATVVTFFVAMLVILLLPLKSTLSHYDEGFAIFDAVRVIDGDIPYRDFWLLYPPGQTYMLAGVFSLSGTTALSARIYDTLIRLAIVIAIYLAIRETTSQGWALAASAVATLLISAARYYAYAVWPALASVFFSIVCLLVYIKSNKARWLIGAGILAGLAAVFRWDIGLYVAISAGAGIFLAQAQHLEFSGPQKPVRMLGAAIRPVAIFSGTAALIVLPCYGIFAITGDFGELWAQIFAFVAVLGPTRSVAIPSLIPPMPSDSANGFINTYLLLVYWMQFYVPILIFVAIAARYGWQIFKRRFVLDIPQTANITLMCLGITFFAQALSRYDFIHVVPSTIVAFLLAVPLVGELISGLRSRATRLAVGLISGLFAAFYLAIPIGMLAFIVNATSPLGCYSQLARAGCIDVDDNQEKAVQYIREHTPDGEIIFVGNQRHDLILANDIAFYFLADRPSGTKYSEMHTGAIRTRSVQEEIIQNLEAVDVQWVILVEMPESQEPNLSSVSSGVTILDEYIDANYSSVITFGGYEILKKKPD